MKRTLALSLAATLLAGLLGACGGDDSSSSSSSGSGSGSDSGGGGDDYCSMLEGAQSDLEGLGPNGGDLEKIRDTFQELQQSAPEEVAGDWKTLSGAVDTLATELDKAGVKLEDLQGLQSGQLPEGVTAKDLAKVAQEVQKLNGAEFRDAAESISTHAKDECDIQLGESESPSAPESDSGN